MSDFTYTPPGQNSPEHQKRTVIAMILMMGLFLAWNAFFAPPPPPPGASTPEAQTTSEALSAKDAAPASGSSAAELTASAAPQQNAPLPAQSELPVREATFQTRTLDLALSSEGGGISRAVLKSGGGEWADYKFEQVFNLESGRDVRSVDLAKVDSGQHLPGACEVSGDASLPYAMRYALEERTSGVTFRASGSDVSVEKAFDFSDDGYDLTASYRVTNNSAVEKRLTLTVVYPAFYDPRHVPKSSLFSPPPDQIQAILLDDGDGERLQAGKGSEEKTFKGPIQFAGFDQRYFLGAMFPRDQKGTSGRLSTSPDGRYEAALIFDLGRVSAGQTVTREVGFFVGPKSHDLLNKVSEASRQGVLVSQMKDGAPLRFADPRLSESIDFGWWAVICRALLAVLNLFAGFVHNWGAAIVLLTFLVKLILFPLNQRQMESMEAMRRIQPKMQELQKKYADDRGDAWLPHVRMIARHRDPRFALELFDFLDREIKRRGEVFGNYGDIIAYRRNGGKIPRILIIIDEFQVMFESYCGQDLSENVAKRLATVFKQGRAYGIHVVLATQSLRSMTFKGMGGILGQVAMRVALYGQKEDGILADNNAAATRITPKRQCIVNPAFGANDAPGVVNNLVADVPFSDPAQVEGCKKFRALVVKTSRDRRLKSACRVFNGAALPDPPPSDAVNEALKPEKWNVLVPVLLGSRTDFSSTPFTVSFTDNPREHMLVAGEDGPLVEGETNPITGEAVWVGIRRGLIRSFRPLRSCEVLWYDPTVPALPDGLPDWFIAVGGRAKEAELLAAFHELASAKAERKIVVVENFQDAMLLHPADAPRPSFGSKPAAPPPETARSLFSAAFSGLETPPFHAILMTRNFGYLHRKVFARSGAEVNLLEACGKRVAFNLAPEVQDIVVPGLSFDAKRGPRRVWFGDVNTGKNVDFLPYSRIF